MDYRPIAEALAEIGYEGYVSVEIHDFNLDPEATAGRCLEYLRRVFR
ncbi:MAG: hypothetical protein O7G87_01510 [bacterium]|nr:hypothetical protein [bacterium]